MYLKGIIGTRAQYKPCFHLYELSLDVGKWSVIFYFDLRKYFKMNVKPIKVTLFSKKESKHVMKSLSYLQYYKNLKIAMFPSLLGKQ